MKNKLDRSFFLLPAASAYKILHSIDQKPHGSEDQYVKNRGKAHGKQRKQYHCKKRTYHNRYVKDRFLYFLQHFKPGGQNQQYNAGLNALECGCHPPYFKKTVEEEGYQIDDNEGRDAHSDR